MFALILCQARGQAGRAISVWGAIGIVLASLGLAPARGGPSVLAHSSAVRALSQESRPLSDSEIRALTNRAIAAQHADDAAAQYYEHMERRVQRRSASGQRILDDRTFRVVPTGTGMLSLLIKTGKQPVDPAHYHQDLQTWERLLEQALHPDAGWRAAYAKLEKKSKERAETVEIARQAFLAQWLGRELCSDRPCVKIELIPNPRFQAHSTAGELLTRARATVWIDEQSAHVARVDADIVRDMAFGGGILGKIYRGGHFFLEQMEVAPGVWQPRRFQYDFSGRKFLFSFEAHQLFELSRYRRVGPPSEAIQVARRDLAGSAALPGDP